MTKFDQWSNYWKQGHITSFGTSLPGNYRAPSRNFWYQQFDALPGGSVILDVAAGNGAVATIAAEYSETMSKAFTVMAADAAIINSELVEASRPLDRYRNKVKFYSNTACEKLPFADGTINLVCSQYGIEYSDLTKSVPEVRRVVGNRGRFAAIMHHTGSNILSETARELSVMDSALHEHKIFTILEQYLTALGEPADMAAARAAMQGPGARKYAEKLNASMHFFRATYPSSIATTTLMKYVKKLFEEYLCAPMEQRISVTRAMQDECYESMKRHRQLQESALSATDMLGLENIAQRAGFRHFVYEKFVTPDKLISGWLVSAGN